MMVFTCKSHEMDSILPIKRGSIVIGEDLFLWAKIKMKVKQKKEKELQRQDRNFHSAYDLFEPNQ